MTGIRRGYVDVEVDAGIHPGQILQIHFRCAGSSDAPALVLLHQTPSTSAMYEPLLHRLARRFHLLALDTPGFGLSDPLPGTFSIAAAASILSAAAGRLHSGACHWFGHHTGAALALQVAADFPDQVERLALSGPCLLDAELRQRLPQLAAPLSPQADGSHLRMLWQRMTAKDATAPLSLRQREVLAGAAAGDAYPQAYRAVLEVDTAAQLRGLSCPTLVFAGTEDPLHSRLDAALALLAHGRKAEVCGARTFLCERQADEVAALLLDFFE